MLFSTPENANRAVAGVPAAARVARAAALAEAERCLIAAPEGLAATAFTSSEIARLAPGLEVAFCSSADAQETSDAVVIGEELPDEERIRSALAAGTRPNMLPEERDSDARLSAQARAIIRSTAKPGDGIVSRSLNRPVSQAITTLLLNLNPAIRPIHATWGTGLLGLAMLACLLTGSATGLMAGAVLFQAASIFDGVDGEIARAAFRSSPEGARIDSLVDAATNLGFIGGVTLNLWLQGERFAAQAGAGGLALFGLGLWLIGRRNRSADGSLTFNAVKEHLAQRPSRIRQWLTWLTMRDFFALAGAIFILTGFAVPGLLAFAVVAAGWFVVVAVVTARHAA